MSETEIGLGFLFNSNEIICLFDAEAFAEIIGTKEKVFKSESNLHLVCALKKATAKPDYIFW